MKMNVVVGSVLLLCACVSLPPRYNYKPKTSDGIQCKASCSQIYRECETDARESCMHNWMGSEKPCPPTAPAIEDQMKSCIADESSCLQVCASVE